MNSRNLLACYPRSTFCPLIDGPSTRNRQVIKPAFPPCSARRPHSQAPLCLYTQHTVTVRAEGTFGRLRYILGGDRPSQTARQTLSFTFVKLEFQQSKGGISLMAPSRLTSRLHSLPPILHMQCQNPVSSCSKGSRGLFVQSQVDGIFTATSISPIPSLRQCPSRYTIRAGRNLPDKEFRYLRTVIVTAAVYQGFGSELLLLKNRRITPSLNLPAPGRCQSLYIVFRLSRDLCFC